MLGATLKLNIYASEAPALRIEKVSVGNALPIIIVLWRRCSYHHHQRLRANFLHKIKVLEISASWETVLTRCLRGNFA